MWQKTRNLGKYVFLQYKHSVATRKAQFSLAEGCINKVHLSLGVGCTGKTNFGLVVGCTQP